MSGSNFAKAAIPVKSSSCAMRDKSRFLASNSQYLQYPLQRFASSMEKLGFRNLDFLPRTPHFWCSHTGYEDPSHLTSLLHERGLSVKVLTPPAYRYSLTASAGRQRQATVDYYVNCLSLAKTLGAQALSLGASGACWDRSEAELRRNAQEMLVLLCTEAEGLGVTLLLSPVMGPETPLIAESPILVRVGEMAQMIRDVGHPRLKVLLETNVMSSVGESIPQWFDLLGDAIGLVRLVDGNYHGWRGWGEGCLPIDRYLEDLDAVGYDGALSILLPGDRYVEAPEYYEETVLSILERR